MPSRRDQSAQAVALIRKHDPVMRRVIDRAGPYTVRPQRDRFAMLVRSIISQQISVSAARSIRSRLEQLLAPTPISPASLSSLSAEGLRTAGVSPQKARYLLDLAGKVHSGTVRLNQLGRLSDDRVIEELTQVVGIGRWTAEMFLIFALGRWDVFSVDDLGVRNAMQRLYGLSKSPAKTECHEIAERWRPYRSVGCWYCWRSLELP